MIKLTHLLKSNKVLLNKLLGTVCQLLNDGVAAIIGPQSPQSASYVQSVCDAVEVPHIETTGDYRTLPGKFSVNLYPHPSTLAMVCKLFNDLKRFRNNSLSSIATASVYSK